MKSEIEIEYKQLLTKEQYKTIKEFILIKKFKRLNHENYYFDSKTTPLKNQGQALRIRRGLDYYELCLKSQREYDIVEQNILLTETEFVNICNDNSLMLKYFKDLPKDIELLGSLKTKRIEYQLEDGLICLDESAYHNIVDYEIEFEANDYDKETVLIDFLKEFSIEYCPNLKSKIQRFVETA